MRGRAAHEERTGKERREDEDEAHHRLLRRAFGGVLFGRAQGKPRGCTGIAPRRSAPRFLRWGHDGASPTASHPAQSHRHRPALRALRLAAQPDSGRARGQSLRETSATTAEAASATSAWLLRCRVSRPSWPQSSRGCRSGSRRYRQRRSRRCSAGAARPRTPTSSERQRGRACPASR